MSTVDELILRNRSYRRFYQQESVSMQTLRELVNLARLSPSAANRQPCGTIFLRPRD